MKNNLQNRTKSLSEYSDYIKHFIIQELSEKDEIDLSTNIELNRFLQDHNIQADQMLAFIAEMSVSGIVRVEGTKLTLLLDDNFMDEK